MKKQLLAFMAAWPVTMVTDHHGSVSMHTGYYPDGEPWRTPAGRSRQLEGKERLTALGLNEYLYPGRHYAASVGLFTTPDPLAADYGWVNPYSYCAGNPNRFTDPTGMVLNADKESQNRIKMGFSEEVQRYIEFDKNGLLNADRLNECKVESENLNDLKLLANSEITTCVRAVTRASGKKDECDLGSDEESRKGVTYLPNTPNAESKDDNINVNTGLDLSYSKQASNMAHELYGHAATFLKGKPAVHDSAPVSNVIFKDGQVAFIFERRQTDLEIRIKRAEREAFNNYRRSVLK